MTGGSGTYNFVAIDTSQANVATLIATGTSPSGLGSRVAPSGGTSHNWTGIANGTWYTAVQDSNGINSVQNVGVSVVCSTTTSTTTTTLPPTSTTTTSTSTSTTTAAPTTTTSTTTTTTTEFIAYNYYTFTPCSGGTGVDYRSTFALGLGEVYAFQASPPQRACYTVTDINAAPNTNDLPTLYGPKTDCSDSDCVQV
jgi:hypothetical protein